MSAPDPVDESATATAAERGDTVPRWVRNLIRLAAVVALVGATTGLAFARNGGGGPPEPVEPLSKATARPQRIERLEPEVAKLAAEDARLRMVSLGEAPQVGWTDGTLVLGAREAPYTLATLVAAGAVTHSGPVYVLRHPVVVRRDATLVIDAPGATLRLASNPQSYTSLVSWGGSITLAGDGRRPLRVVGWNTLVDRPDTDVTDGRAYVRVKDGTLTVTDVDLSSLGYWSGRTGGLSLTGSSETSAVGTLDHVDIRDTHIGLYLSGARHVVVRHTDIRDTARHGLEASNRSEGVRLRHVQIHDAGEDGISVSNGSAHVALSNVQVYRSGGYGLQMDGSPLATGPNSAGYGTENYAGLSLARSTFLDNALGGVAVRSLDDVSVTDRTVIGSDLVALDVHGRSDGLSVSDSRLLSADASGLVVSGGVRDAQVSASRIRGAAVAVQVTGSQIELRDNDLSVGTGHGVQVDGANATATVADNTISGRGSGAVHASGGARVTQSGNTTRDWTYRPAALMWAERHTAAMPLLLVLLLPVFGTLFVVRRRRQQHELRRLFEAALVTQGRSTLAAYDPLSGRRTLDLPAARAAAAGRHLGLGERVVAAPSLAPGALAAPARPATTGQGAGLASLEGRQFGSAREFAIAAVLDAGFPPSQVAQVLHLPTSRVRTWVAEGEAASSAEAAPAADEPVEPVEPVEPDVPDEVEAIEAIEATDGSATDAAVPAP